MHCLSRNRWQSILKNCSLSSLLLLSPCFAVYELFQLAGALKKGRGVEWIRVISWRAANSFAVSRRRRIIQRGRKVPDVDISQGVPLRFTNDLTTSAVERFFQRMLSRFFESYWRIVKEYLPWQKIVPVFFVTINEIR